VKKFVIASEAKQSIGTRNENELSMDCFVASLLAMTTSYRCLREAM
jgi:hypothetical protein